MDKKIAPLLSIITLQIMLVFVCIPLWSIGQKKETKRQEIDTKRYDIDMDAEDVLPKSKEFIRMDSTYYVGWMLDGIYKFNRSADMSGYKNAATALRKSYDLILADFDGVFKTLFKNYFFLTQNYRRLEDLMMITEALTQCYDNINLPDSTMRILSYLDKYNFKINNVESHSLGLYHHKSWLYHRNRFFTNKHFYFLKNSVQANEAQALKTAYNGLAFATANEPLVNEWLGERVTLIERLQHYHNLAILHSYNKNYDSCIYYYEQLNDYGIMSENNYASFQKEIGLFSNAAHYYTIAMHQADQEHGLQEPYYYLPELLVFAGHPKKAIEQANQIITRNGSTPGFGWYNIALARGYLYDGQLDSCAIALKKAQSFKEVHIGTTLTQSQYDFTINLLKLQMLNKKVAQIKFQHKNWWYSPTLLWKILSLKIDTYLVEYNTASQLAKNPEKNRMVYDLFCSESTTTFDEVWYLLKDFSASFFERMYKDYITKDKRSNIQRYFELFEAKFQLQGGKTKKAKVNFASIYSKATIDTAYEKLFMARLYEGLIKTNKASDKTYTQYLNALYTTYPQLIPFSNITMPIRLVARGTDNKNIQQVLNDLKKCNIEWTIRNDIPQAYIDFEQRGNKYRARINTFNAQGNPIVVNEEVFFSKTKNAGQEIALRLFGKGGAKVID